MILPDMPLTSMHRLAVSMQTLTTGTGCGCLVHRGDNHRRSGQVLARSVYTWRAWTRAQHGRRRPLRLVLRDAYALPKAAGLIRGIWRIRSMVCTTVTSAPEQSAAAQGRSSGSPSPGTPPLRA